MLTEKRVCQVYRYHKSGTKGISYPDECWMKQIFTFYHSYYDGFTFEQPLNFAALFIPGN